MTRVLTAAALLPLLWLSIKRAPAWSFYALVVLVMAIAAWECYALLDAFGARPLRLLGLAACLAVTGSFAWPGSPPAPALPLALGTIATLAGAMWRREDPPAMLRTAGATLFPVLFVGLTFGYPVALRELRGEDGTDLLLLLSLCVMTGDTAAFYVGSKIGRHRLAPVVSPKKSWEGAVAGVAGSVLAALTAHFWFYQRLPLVHAVVLGVLLGIAGIVGDLAESMVKRAAGAKDSSGLLPGHGGLLDRIDSLLFSGPLLYYYSLKFLGSRLVKHLAILGSTGSIGRSTIDVVLRHPDRFRVLVLAAGRNLSLLEEQARLLRPEVVSVADASGARTLRERLGPAIRILHGPDGLVEAARVAGVDTVVSALVGAAGLPPTWAAVDAGRTVALANKEALVVGGAFLTKRARETGALLLPVDSEHNALHQCLRGENPLEVRRLWLTASGGPFRTRALDTMGSVTPEEALRHPTWTMGRKVTIDSATLMNKGLEVIEAKWLFGVAPDQIRVVIHPTSIVHSLVELVDGSFKAQLSDPDMRHPIQYALTWPERVPSGLPPFDPVRSGPLEFFDPDPERFPCLGLAFEALAHGGAAPAVLNAANEIAVAAFLDGALGFREIPVLLRRVLDVNAGDPADDLDQVLAADSSARATAARVLTQGAPR